MLISNTHKFIFFHVAKTAGLSIRAALQGYTQEPEKFKIRRPPQMSGDAPNPLYHMWETMLLHAKAKDAQKAFSPEVYNSYYKFAFVRNPWDWQVSMYHFILKETQHISYERVKAMTSFEEYLEWVIATKKPFARGATKFQKDVITNAEGQIIVDFIGRYETLSQDFDRICQQLNIQASLPHKNQSSHRDYSSYYNQRSQKMVADHFQEDIALLGYSYQGYQPSPDLERSLSLPPQS